MVDFGFEASQEDAVGHNLGCRCCGVKARVDCADELLLEAAVGVGWDGLEEELGGDAGVIVMLCVALIAHWRFVRDGLDGCATALPPFCHTRCQGP